MTAYLLALTVGPVQEFIAAARRTRDLWFGSYLLSEISKAAARTVRDQGGELIFPAPSSNNADLDPGSLLSVANVILAELSDVDPTVVVAEAKSAAQSRWRSFADQVPRTYQSVINSDIWNDQVDDVIEFFAAWHTYSPETYKTDRAAVMRLLAARKRCRDFPRARGRVGVPKSSLDGLRESVLRNPREWPEGSRRNMRLNDGEQLDVVGLVKRTWQPGSGSLSYPSVARIAGDPWIRFLESRQISLLPLIRACSALGPEIVHKFNIDEQRGYPQYAAFPFEGTGLFRSRHRDLRKEAAISDDHPQFAELVSALEEIAKNKGVPGEPSPYLGVLVADGDRMGRALSKLNTPDEHRQFSQALAGFAGEAARIVREHYGVLVYAGGDDVLAFAPVDHCLACARELHDRFGEILKDWSTKTGTGLTLSVGLAIAHFMEPLEDILGYGRAAEQHAKRPRPEDGEQSDRDGLAIHVVKRGGGPLTMRANWSADPAKHLRQLAEWIASQSISGRLAYEMRKLADLYDTWPADLVKDAIQRDVQSVMQGKQPRGATSMHEIASLVRDRVRDANSLRGLANDLLVAKAIGSASSSSAGRNSPS